MSNGNRERRDLRTRARFISDGGMARMVVPSLDEDLHAMGEGVIELLIARGETEADKVITIHSVRGYANLCLSCQSPKNPCNWHEWATEAKRRMQDKSDTEMTATTDRKE